MNAPDDTRYILGGKHFPAEINGGAEMDRVDTDSCRRRRIEKHMSIIVRSLVLADGGPAGGLHAQAEVIMDKNDEYLRDIYGI